MKMNRKKIYKKLLYSFVVLSILTFFLVLFHVNKTNIYLIQEEFLLGLTDNLLVHTPHINYTQGESCEFEIQKNTIILRLDDIAAWTYKDISRDIINEVLERNMSITLGVIPEYLEKDRRVVNWLNSIKRNPNIEIALHGYNHEPNEFMNLSKDEALEKIVKGKNKIKYSLGVVPVTFIPPYNEYSEAVKEALIEQGFKIFSAKEDEYEIDDIISLGYNARTYDFYTSRFVPVDEVLEACKNSLRERGICVVMIHPQDYLVAEGSKEIDEEKYNEFIKLLDGLEDFNADFKNFKDVANCRV